MLEQITNSFVGLLDSVGYLGIFLAALIESFFAPIPSEVVLITAGFYAQTQGSYLGVILISIVAALGAFVGTLPFYLIARYSSETFLPRFLKKWGVFLLISPKDLEKSQEVFKTKGPAIVFFCRLIPGIRSLIAFPAGASKMSHKKYFVFTVLGSFIWNMFLTTVGFVAYEQKDEIFSFLKPVENLVIIGLGVAVLFYILSIIYQVRKIKKIEGEL